MASIDDQTVRLPGTDTGRQGQSSSRQDRKG
jgi:hypothetical protein